MFFSEALLLALSALSLVASPYASAVPLREAVPVPLQADALVWVGPEGDFTPKEIERIVQSDGKPVTLGKIILRVETAAMVCLSVLATNR